MVENTDLTLLPVMSLLAADQWGFLKSPTKEARLQNSLQSDPATMVVQCIEAVTLYVSFLPSGTSKDTILDIIHVVNLLMRG